MLPNGKNGVLLIDSGANAECTPEYLLQFAYMGSFYSREILGCAEPRVGLLILFLPVNDRDPHVIRIVQPFFPAFKSLLFTYMF